MLFSYPKHYYNRMEREATNSDVWHSFITNIELQKEKRNAVYACCTGDLGKYNHRRIAEAVKQISSDGKWLVTGHWRNPTLRSGTSSVRAYGQQTRALDLTYSIYGKNIYGIRKEGIKDRCCSYRSGRENRASWELLQHCLLQYKKLCLIRTTT